MLASLESDALVHTRPPPALTARRFPDVDVPLVVAGGASVGHIGKPESNADALGALESSAVCEGERVSLRALARLVGACPWLSPLLPDRRNWTRRPATTPNTTAVARAAV